MGLHSDSNFILFYEKQIMQQLLVQMLKLKVIFRSGKEEIYNIFDYGRIQDDFNDKLRRGIIKDYEVLE